jgi:hypothetical protein
LLFPHCRLPELSSALKNGRRFSADLNNESVQWGQTTR